MKYKFKQKLFSKIASIVICLFLASLFPSLVKAQQTNFTGNWVRDTDRTNVSEGLSVNSVPVSLAINQTSSGISIKRNSANGKGEAKSYTETLSFNGSATETNPPSGLKKKASLQWAADQKTFVENASFTNNQGEGVQSNTETWSLSADGKTLTINIVIKSPDQQFTAEEVFNKE
jgi:hypothetical protein